MLIKSWKNCATFILVSALLISSMVGCSGNNTAPSPTDSTTAARVSSSASDEKKPEDYKGTISMWGWDEVTMKGVIPEFNKVYPNIKIDFVPVSSGNYTQKVQTSVASNMELPDILWQEYKQRGVLYQMDIWEDLRQAPYNFDTSSVFDYCIPATSKDNKTLGIEWFVNAAGLAYRKGPAKQYLGTDDPVELKKILSSWDAFIEKGKEVKAKSNGKVFMFASVEDAMTVISGNTFEAQPSVFDENNRMDLDKTFGTAFDTIVKMRDAGIIDKLSQWSPAWNNAISKDNHIFYPGATWTPHYIIEPNDPNGEGKWGLMISPGPAFNWGGTAMGITKASKNKDLAWQFIKWFLLSTDGAKVSRDVSAYFSNFKKAYDDPGYAKYTNKFFGNQDLGDVWINQITPRIKNSNINKYDALVQEVSTTTVQALFKDHSLTKEEALEKLKNELLAKAPDLN
jgi:multiple sugar transport system substrate-binding protein